MNHNKNKNLIKRKKNSTKTSRLMSDVQVFMRNVVACHNNNKNNNKKYNIKIKIITILH